MWYGGTPETEAYCIWPFVFIVVTVGIISEEEARDLFTM